MVGQWRGMTVAFAATLTWTLATVAAPRFIQGALDEGVEANDRSALVRWTLGMVGCGIVAALAMGAWYYLEARASRRADVVLRRRIFTHLQELHAGFHDRSPTGQLMSRANTDLQQIHGLLNQVPSTVAALLKLVIVVAVLVRTNPSLSMLSLAALPALTVVAVRFRNRLYPASEAVQREHGELADVVEDTISGMRVLKGFGTESVQGARFVGVVTSLYEKSLALGRIRANYLPAWDLVPAIGVIAVLWFGGTRVINGQLSIGEFVAFNTYLLMLVWPLSRAGAVIAVMQRALAAAERVGEVLATESEITKRPGAKPLPAGTGEVRFEGVSFSYTSTFRAVLEDFSLVVPAGGSVALAGPTGSGKSTVAQLVARFYDVDRGRVLIDGVDVRELRPPELRRAVGIVFEEAFLFGDTIRANIAFSDPDVSDAEVEQAARLAGAHEFMSELPDGYATVVGERGFSLSGGQRQRIAIARTIISDPRVLVLDDATSSVDPTKEHEIRAALVEVMKGRTTIVIAHRAATLALADRVALLDEGRIVAEGTHHDLLASSPRYREFLALASHSSGDSDGLA